MHNEWRGSALCAQTGPEVFFPQNKAYVDDYNGYDNYKIARKICAECKKAAKAYDGAGVYDAKVLAEKQGFALREEAVNATN